MFGITLFKYHFLPTLALLRGILGELKSGSVPLSLEDSGARHIIMIVLLVVCSILVLNYELIYGAGDTVFLVHFLRQMQTLYLHSYLRHSQVRFLV